METISEMSRRHRDEMYKLGKRHGQAAERSALIEVVEGMKKEVSPGFSGEPSSIGYNAALDDVLSHLREADLLEAARAAKKVGDAIVKRHAETGCDCEWCLTRKPAKEETGCYCDIYHVSRKDQCPCKVHCHSPQEDKAEGDLSE